MYPLDPPFELGATLSGKDSDGNLINREKLGMMWDFYTVPVNAQRGKKAFPGGGKRIRCVTAPVASVAGASGALVVSFDDVRRLR